MRDVRHRYIDPLERIWITTAVRIGLQVTRSDDVYASTDGRGGLRLGVPESLDTDDCLAQMIYHELCHSLIEGPEAFERPDWGLDNTDTHDNFREWACLRLQAVLSTEYGLQGMLAPTTDFRAFYDQLPTDPLTPRREASVTLAILGLQRVDKLPWAPHLRDALEATAQVASAAAKFVQPAPPRPRGLEPGSSADESTPTARDLFSEVTTPLERHPVGFARMPDGARTQGDDSSARTITCASCAWMYHGGRGRAVHRCRQADGVRVEGTWNACDRYEPALDCQDCGACCREAYHSVTVPRRDPAIARVSELIVDRGAYLELKRVSTPTGSRCVALSGGDISDNGDWQPYHCTVYGQRPRPCREFENAGAHCLTARRRVGLSR